MSAPRKMMYSCTSVDGGICRPFVLRFSVPNDRTISKTKKTDGLDQHRNKKQLNSATERKKKRKKRKKKKKSKKSNNEKRRRTLCCCNSSCAKHNPNKQTKQAENQENNRTKQGRAKRAILATLILFLPFCNATVDSTASTV